MGTGSSGLVYGDTYRLYSIRRHRCWVSCGLARRCRKRLLSIFCSRFHRFDTDISNCRPVNGRQTGNEQMHICRLQGSVGRAYGDYIRRVAHSCEPWGGER
jgi:hypothetical protein